MNEGINAKWAKDKATQILGDKVKGEIEKCEVEIVKAVNDNKYTCGVNIYADIATLKELRGRGFSLQQNDDQRDGPWLVIHWV